MEVGQLLATKAHAADQDPETRIGPGQSAEFRGARPCRRLVSLKLAWTEIPAGLRICRLPDRLSTPLAARMVLFAASRKEALAMRLPERRPGHALTLLHSVSGNSTRVARLVRPQGTQ